MRQRLKKGYSQNAFLGKINIDSMMTESSFSHKKTTIKERTELNWLMGYQF
jgi:hypothetical protein